MSVFLSYTRADRGLAVQVVRALRGLGVDVWWDEDMAGVDWRRELERRLNELDGVLVLWTPASMDSDYVCDEARLALDSRKLINVLVGAKKPPFPYDRVNALPLDGWDGRAPHPGWARVVKTVEDRLAEAGVHAAGTLTTALARRDDEVRQRQAALADAEEAARDARTREAAAKDADAEARAAFKAAEEQVRHVSGLATASSKLLRAVHFELDEARDAKDAAEKERKAAAADRTAADRALARARTDLERMFDDGAAPVAAHGATLAPLQVGGHDEATTRSPTNPLDADMMYKAGCQYRDGRGVEQDYGRAMAWFRWASDHGHAGAQCNVGYLYANGLGVERDFGEAMNWYLKAGELGDAAAMYSVGVLHFYGRGVVEDHAQAFAWYRRAADHGYAQAQYKVGQFHADGLLGARDYREAMAWYVKAADQGDAVAQYSLGALYLYGQGVSQDFVQAMIWFRKAADQGVPVAQYGVGYLYGAGQGVPRDLAQARFWHLKAAAGGSQDAKDWLARHPD